MMGGRRRTRMSTGCASSFMLTSWCIWPWLLLLFLLLNNFHCGERSRILTTTTTYAMVIQPSQRGRQQRRTQGQSKSSSSSSNNSDSSNSSQRRQKPRRNNNNNNKSWYNKRKVNGIKVTKRPGSNKKPPKWEKEGDDLYREIVVETTDIDDKSSSDISKSILTAQKLLLDLQKKKQQNEDDGDGKKEEEPPQGKDDNNNNEPPFLWGGLSVGPVLKSRLVQKHGYNTANPIQKEAFQPIVNKQNCIIASPTGSGKSIAYLLPLLASKGNNKLPCKIWIITPTLELALQLSQVANSLSGSSDTAFVLQKQEEGSSSLLSSFMMSADESSPPTILIGTPRRFLELLNEIDSSSILSSSQDLVENLQTIVLDEADRLLKTEEVAIANDEWKKLQQQQQQQQLDGDDDSTSKRKKSSPTRGKRPILTFTEDVVSQCLDRRRSSDLQIICASATVGRTLRKQIMTLTRSASMDKAATLITADIRTKKDITKRKLSLLPQTLQHYYHIVGSSSGSYNDDGDDDSTTTILDMISTKDYKSAILNDLSKIVLSDDDDDTLLSSSSSKAGRPGPTLIFPGRIGVDRVQEFLKKEGFQNVYGLDDIVAAAAAAAAEGKQQQQNQDDDDDSKSPSNSWKIDTPIYVVNEKVSRGLDLDYIDYVVLLQVPKTVASYTHLVGRTGRNGLKGTAITLLCPPVLESLKLQVISNTLGLSFQNILLDVDVDVDVDKQPSSKQQQQEFALQDTSLEQQQQQKDEDDDDELSQSQQSQSQQQLLFGWKSLSESTLKRKTIAEITEYLSLHNVSLTESLLLLSEDSNNSDDGMTPQKKKRKLKKADLIQAVHELHDG